MLSIYEFGQSLIKLSFNAFLRKALVMVGISHWVCVASMYAYADPIFSENFNSLPDQSIKGRCVYEGHPGDPEGICDSIPKKWDFIYTSDKNPTNPPAEISSEAGRTGKGFRVYDESYGDDNSWGHDIQLAKHFSPDQFSELWISLWIRFNPNLNTNGLGAAKIFRMGHYNPQVIDGTTATSVVNTNKVTSEGPTTSGLMFYDVKHISNTEYYRHKIALRGDPSYKMGFEWNRSEFELKDENGVYADRTWTGGYGDGNWHKFEVGMVMNSSPGIEDGKIYVYLDGVYQGGKSNVPWLQSGHDPDVYGFNMFTIGGNADFIWDGQSNAEQYFYDIDDIEVCLKRCTVRKWRFWSLLYRARER